MERGINFTYALINYALMVGVLILWGFLTLNIAILNRFKQPSCKGGKACLKRKRSTSTRHAIYTCNPNWKDPNPGQPYVPGIWD